MTSARETASLPLSGARLWQASPVDFLRQHPDSRWRVRLPEAYQADTLHRGQSLAPFLAAAYPHDSSFNNDCLLFHVIEDDDALAVVTLSNESLLVDSPPYPGTVTPCGGTYCDSVWEETFCKECYGGDKHWFQRKFYPDRTGAVLLDVMNKDGKRSTTTVTQLDDKNRAALRDEQSKREAEEKRLAERRLQQAQLDAEIRETESALHTLRVQVSTLECSLYEMRKKRAELD